MRTSVFTDELAIHRCKSKTGPHIPTDGDRAEISGKCIFIKIRLQIFAVQQVFQRVSLSQLVSRKSKHKNRGFGTNHHQVSLPSDYISRNILRVKFQMLCSMAAEYMIFE